MPNSLRSTRRCGAGRTGRAWGLCTTSSGRVRRWRWGYGRGVRLNTRRCLASYPARRGISTSAPHRVTTLSTYSRRSGVGKHPAPTPVGSGQGALPCGTFPHPPGSRARLLPLRPGRRRQSPTAGSHRTSRADFSPLRHPSRLHPSSLLLATARCGAACACGAVRHAASGRAGAQCAGGLGGVGGRQGGAADSGKGRLICLYSELVVLDHCGHMPQVEQPEACVRIARQFLG